MGVSGADVVFNCPEMRSKLAIRGSPVGNLREDTSVLHVIR
jgi:hypothetical protein